MGGGGETGEPERSGGHVVEGLRRVLQGRYFADAPDPGLRREPQRLLDLLRGAGGVAAQRLLPADQLHRADFDLFGETPMATSSPRARRPSMAADIAARAPTVALTTLAPPRASTPSATSRPPFSTSCPPP